MRRYLLCAASISVIAQGTAYAQDVATLTDPVDINEDKEGPVRSATIDDGSTSDISISKDGRVYLSVNDYAAGPALLINSASDVYIKTGGVVELESKDSNKKDVTTDGGVAVQLAPGASGDFESKGTIRALDGYDAKDSGTDLVDFNKDGKKVKDKEADGPFAKDTNKTGLLVGEVDKNYQAVANQKSYKGNIALTKSAVTVEGQDSYGVRVVTNVEGNLALDGRVTMTGERSTGISINGNVSGDLSLGTVATRSPDGTAVELNGDVGGGIRITGSVNSTGYRAARRLSKARQAAVDAGDDDLNAAAGMIIAGSAKQGLFIGKSGSVNLISGVGHALEIGASGKTLNFGEVILPDDWGITKDKDKDKDSDGEAQGYGFVLRGSVSAASIFDGRNASGLMIGGLDENGNAKSVIFGSGGILNRSGITALSYDGVATAMTIGAGTKASKFHSQGGITATTTLGYKDDGYADDKFKSGRAYALVVQKGAELTEIFNDQGNIYAFINGGGQSATAILLNSDQVETILNTGSIIARTNNLNDDHYDGDETFELIALDARANTSGVTLKQVKGKARDLNNDDKVDDPRDPFIIGDILLGSGNDTLDIRAGQVTGDIAFGDGADRLLITDSKIIGGVTDSDGKLQVEINDGTLELKNSDTLYLTNVSVTNEGVLDIIVNSDAPSDAFINASGDITFDDTSKLSIGLSEMVGEKHVITLLKASDLKISSDQAVPTQDAPFIYNTTVARSNSDENALVLTLERKTSAELGLLGSRATAYAPVLALFEDTKNLGDAFAGLRNKADFMLAYDQLLPEYATSAIQFALASNDAATGALATRLTNARQAPDGLAGMWVQEFGYYADRSGGALGPGYRGEGIGLAMGVDMPWGPFYAVGMNVVGAASEMEEVSGFDDPMVSITGQIGLYAALEKAGFDISASGSIGIDSFETERNVRVGKFSAVYHGNWTGWHSSASLQAGRDYAMGKWVLRPEANLTYLGLWEQGFTEKANDDTVKKGNKGLALTVNDRESSVLLGSTTVSIERRFGTEKSWWAPNVRFGYRGEFLGETNNTRARFGANGNAFTLSANGIPNSGALVGFGVNAGSQYSTFTFAYDADIRDQFVRHVARIMIRLTF